MEIIAKPAVSYPPTTRNLNFVPKTGTSWYGSKTWTLAKTVAHNVYHDKDRYVFLKQNGRFPQYPYTVVHHDGYLIETGSAMVTWSAGTQWHSCVDTFRCDYWLTAEYSTAAVTALKTSLHNSVTAQINANVKNLYYSTFETLYEGRKTKKMVGDAVFTIAGALSDVKKGRFAKAARRLGLAQPPKGAKPDRSLSQNWLEFRYGWGPLYYTIYGEMKRQYDRMKNQEPVQRVSVKREGRIPDYETLLGNTYVGYHGENLRFYHRVRSVQSQQVIAKQVVYYKVHNQTLAEATSIGLTNPLLVAWELVPFSFVADWFVNVSDCLDAFDAWAGKTYLTGTKTTLVRAQRVSYGEWVSATSGYTTAAFKPSKYKVTSVQTVREILSSPPSVSLNFSVGLTNRRLVDGLALIRQLVGKR